jgi:hypothetical protein
LDLLPTTNAQKRASLMTLDFQAFHDVSFPAVRSVTPDGPPKAGLHTRVVKLCLPASVRHTAFSNG